jgi:allantoinase
VTADCELLVRGGRVVTPWGVTGADVAVAEGRIVALGQRLGWTADEEVDARGLHVFAGGIDSHVHFNDPGRTEWETIADGSVALAAGGYSTFVDMPLNSRPVTVDGEAFDRKLEVANDASLVDFGLWGGLVPGNLDRLEELVERGAAGFKAFMSPSGVDEFRAADDHTLAEGMRRIAGLGSILLVHAEASGIVETLTRRAIAEGRLGPRDFVRSRPAAAELDAISRIIFWAEETGCPVHVVHVSTARGALMIAEARGRGVDVSAETCPHYLLYTEEDVERLGGVAKCAPPPRTAADRAALWRLLAAGVLDMVVSDHSPGTSDLKRGDDFFRIWGGISGCQSTRQLLLAHDHRLDLPAVAALTAANVARRFRLGGKGEVGVGFDADLWLVDLAERDVVRARDLRYRNPFSVHEGQPVRGRTVRTMVRGRTVFRDGRVVAEPIGRLIRPGPPTETLSPD